MKIANWLWDEWLSGEITDAVSAESELAGLVSAMDRTSDGFSVTLASKRYWVFHRFRRLWSLCPLSQGQPLNEALKLGRGQVALNLPTEKYHQIRAVENRDAFIRWAWARGLFGSCGGLYAPRSGNYCLVRLLEGKTARIFKDLLKKSGMNVSCRIKAGRHEVILRGLEDILSLCHNMGLHQAIQFLQERSLVRALRDRANRQANCDEANIRRSVEAASRQCQWVRFLFDRGVELPETLEQLAHIRIQNPSASLAELGTLLHPPMSKSTIKYRWQRIQRMAEERGFCETSPSAERVSLAPEEIAQGARRL